MWLDLPQATETAPHGKRFRCIEAPPRFELGIKDLQSSALPLGYGANKKKRRPRTPPFLPQKAGNRTRTGDPHLGKVMLYQLSYSREISKNRKVEIASASVKARNLKLRYLTPLSKGRCRGE